MNPKKEELSNWQIAEIVYALRLVIDKLERRDLNDSEKEVIYMAYRAMHNANDEIKKIVDLIESEYNDDE